MKLHISTERKAGRRALVVSVSLALAASASIFAPAAFASPADDKVEAAKAAENSAANSVADIEAQLVKLSAYTQDVRDQAEDAEAGYNDAISNLVVAKETADKTAKDSQEAKGKVEEARKALGGLARTVYTTQGSLSSLTPYLHADGLQTVEMRKVSVELFGSKADSQMQTFDSIAKVASVLEARAKAAQNEKAEAARDLKTQKEAADKLKADTEQKLASLGAQREELVKKLAAARGVTEQAEKERQEQIEAERKAREEAAKQAALKAAEEQAKREAAEAARKAAEKKAREEEAAKRAESNRKSKDSKASSSQRKNKSNTASSSDSKANNTSEKTSSASQHGSRAGVISYAKQFIGVPYVWGGSTPKGFDCSGLTSYVYRNAAGISLPRRAIQQRSAGTIIPKSQAQPGDMVNYRSHVGIYLGNGYMIHAPKPGDKVKIARVYGNPVYVRVL